MLQKSQSGRSILELLAVLAIMGMLAVSGVFLFNHLFRYYQQKETDKEMETVVTRFRGNSLARVRNGNIVMKDLVPEAGDKAKQNHLQTANGGTLVLKNNQDTFVVVGSNLGKSCSDIISDHSYNAVGYFKGKMGADGKTIPLSNDEIDAMFSSMGSDELMTRETIDNMKKSDSKSYQQVVNDFCDLGNNQYFIYNKAEGGASCAYLVNGQCSECPEGKEMAKKKNKQEEKECCSTGRIECGYCGGCPTGKCLNNKCQECETDGDCGVSKSHCIAGVCRVCGTVGEKCDDGISYCRSDYTCEKCDTTYKEWINGICVCKKIRPALGEKCAEDCGCSEGQCDNGRCVETRCTEPKSHWNGTDCVCPAPKIVYDEASQKCICPLGTEGEDCTPILGETCPNILGKGGACSAYSAFPNSCCGIGLSCQNNKCQCTAIPTNYGDACSPDCGCDSNTEFVCKANKCDCPPDKPFWYEAEKRCAQCLVDTDCTDTQYCDSTEKVCKECPGSGNGCQKCSAGSWVPDSAKDGQPIKDCGICNSGTIEADATKFDAICQTCSIPDGTITNAEDGSAKDMTGKCCVGGKFVEDQEKCGCPKDAPIGYDPVTCQCPEGFAPEKTFSGEMKCFPICKGTKEPASIVFLFDDSSSLKKKINKTTILDQIKKAVEETEIPNGIKYAIYRTDYAAPLAKFDDYGNNSKAVSVAKSLSGNTAPSCFKQALNAVASDVCSKDEKLLLLMYTDGEIDLHPAEFGFRGDGTSSCTAVKNACKSGTKMLVMTKQTFDCGLPIESFQLGDTAGMNAAINKYLENYYCVEK